VLLLVFPKRSYTYPACKVYHFLKAASTNKQCVGVYHADLTSSTKHSTYLEFSSSTSDLGCLVAAVAFGMVCMHMILYNVYCSSLRTFSSLWNIPRTVAQLYKV
jgi:hypothetical protein